MHTLATARAIKAVPPPLRRLIHYLETNADAAEMVHGASPLGDQIKALEIVMADAARGNSDSTAQRLF